MLLVSTAMFSTVPSSIRAASATEGGTMPSRNRAEDNAARSFLDSKGAFQFLGIQTFLMSSHGMPLSRSLCCRCCYSDHGRGGSGVEALGGVAAGTFMSKLEPLCLTYLLLCPGRCAILYTGWWHTLLTSSCAFPSHMRL